MRNTAAAEVNGPPAAAAAKYAEHLAATTSRALTRRPGLRPGCQGGPLRPWRR